MFVLYYYKAGDAAHNVFTDLSCRRDPDFNSLTFGICRPPLRKRLFQLNTPITFLFYTIQSGSQALLLTALVHVKTQFPTHTAASNVLTGQVPTNLLVPANPCRCKTVFNSAMTQTIPYAPQCSCQSYISRANTPFFIFDRQTALIRVASPVRLPFPVLLNLIPSFFSKYPTRKTWSKFQQATSNDIHEICDPLEQKALEAYFASQSVTPGFPIGAAFDHRLKRSCSGSKCDSN